MLKPNDLGKHDMGCGSSVGVYFCGHTATGQDLLCDPDMHER